MSWYLTAGTNIALLGFLFSIYKTGNNVHPTPAIWFATTVLCLQAPIQNLIKVQICLLKKRLII